METHSDVDNGVRVENHHVVSTKHNTGEVIAKKTNSTKAVPTPVSEKNSPATTAVVVKDAAAATTTTKQVQPKKPVVVDFTPEDSTSTKDKASDQLPIIRHRKQICKAIQKKQVVILVGETGSGKTTQVPKFLDDLFGGEKNKKQNNGGSNNNNWNQQQDQQNPWQIRNTNTILCTQPRRVAATSVAARVSQELGTTLGEHVGYRVRFQDCSSPGSKILFLTDGMAVREAVNDNLFSNYSAVILDEAHERSVQTDVLMGLVLEASRKRKDLKVVVMSATLQVDPFVKYFGGPGNCEVVRVPGRQHKVNLYYTPTAMDDWLQACATTVFQVHRNKSEEEIGGMMGIEDASGGFDDVDALENDDVEDDDVESALKKKTPARTAAEEDLTKGDILVFLPGQDSIEALQHILEEGRRTLEDDLDDLRICPLYAALPFDEQLSVFEPAPYKTRKVVLATNIAETSITIPGIRFVVDCGYVKLKISHPTTGVECLKLAPTSKAQADQRSGRAGREAPGECYRMYPEEEYEKMLEQTPPEIIRSEFSQLYLTLKALKIKDVAGFPFLDKPPQQSLIKAAFYLKKIQAITRTLDLTPLGHKLARLPLRPQFGNILVNAQEFGCIAEILTIVAMLSLDAVFYYTGNTETTTAKGNNNDRAKQQKENRDRLMHYDGDHLSLLQIYREYSATKNKKSFCYEHGLSFHVLQRAEKVRDQLKDLMLRELKVEKITSCGKNLDQVRKALVKGSFTHLARLETNLYCTMGERQQARIHPTSSLFFRKPQPEVILYTEMVTTTKNYLRTCIAVEPQWLIELCPQQFSAGGV